MTGQTTLSSRIISAISRISVANPGEYIKGSPHKGDLRMPDFAIRSEDQRIALLLSPSLKVENFCSITNYGNRIKVMEWNRFSIVFN